MKYDRASKGSRGSASQWNGFLDMHKAFYGNTVGQGLIPPILQSSTIVPATLKSGVTAIGAYQPVRIVKNFGFKNIVDSMPSYEVEPVDATDENGDPTDRHGNYGFTLGEGITAESGGRIVVSGIALVAVNRDQCVDGSQVGANYLGTPFDGYDGKYESAWYIVPDGTLSDDTETVISPVGHFKIISWYDTSDIENATQSKDDTLYLAVDMSRRFTSASVEIFAAISGYSGEYDDQTYNQGYAYLERPLEGVPAEIADVNPRISNNSGEPNTPSIKNGEANYFRCLVTNTHLYDIAEGTHVVSYSQCYNKLIVTGDPVHNDGRINTWYYNIDPNELVSRGHAGEFHITSGWGDIGTDNTDTCPYPTEKPYPSSEILTKGKMCLATDYMTKGGSGYSETSKAQGVPSITADPISPCIVLMLDDDHEYATWAKKPYFSDEKILVSAPYGEFHIIDRKPLHNESESTTYPQWNRCLGFLKNVTTTTMVVELSDIEGADYETGVRGIKPSSSKFKFDEVDEVTGTFSNRTPLQRGDQYYPNRPNPQYSCNYVHHHRITFDSTSDFETANSESNGVTLYVHNPRATFRVIGREADGTETVLRESEWWQTKCLMTADRAAFMASFSGEFIWEEKHIFVFFEIETDGDLDNSGCGFCAIHRRTNYENFTNHHSGKLFDEPDCTLPPWPTYPNGDVESAGVSRFVR